jgi:hypothetical protein
MVGESPELHDGVLYVRLPPVEFRFEHVGQLLEYSLGNVKPNHSIPGHVQQAQRGAAKVQSGDVNVGIEGGRQHYCPSSIRRARTTSETWSSVMPDTRPYPRPRFKGRLPRSIPETFAQFPGGNFVHGNAFGRGDRFQLGEQVRREIRVVTVRRHDLIVARCCRPTEPLPLQEPISSSRITGCKGKPAPPAGGDFSTGNAGNFRRTVSGTPYSWLPRDLEHPSTIELFWSKICSC